jgi:pseudouridine-5'-phosphate glycosidase
MSRRSAPPARVALETTLLLHGVPRASAAALRRELEQIVRDEGAEPSLVGVVQGAPTTAIDDRTFDALLNAPSIPKLNTSNLGPALARGAPGATSVSTTMELAARAGIRVFATGGLGGVHRDFARHLDISADLVALTRFPVGVVSSGVKSILDVPATRELLETLGVPVIGFGTDHFPAFYLRQTSPPLPVDARFDDVVLLARFLARELARTSRGVLVVNPIPAEHELAAPLWNAWLADAQREADEKGVAGREWTPFILGRVHELSGGATLRANIALVKSNARLAAQIASAMRPTGSE